MSVAPTNYPNFSEIANVQPGKVTINPDGSYTIERSSAYANAASYQTPQNIFPQTPPLVLADDFFTPQMPPIMVQAKAPDSSSPAAAAAKRGLKDAFSPKQLGLDAIIGAGFALVFKGIGEVISRISKEPRYVGWGLGWIPIYMGIGVVFRLVMGANRGYENAKQMRNGFWG